VNRHHWTHLGTAVALGLAALLVACEQPQPEGRDAADPKVVKAEIPPGENFGAGITLETVSAFEDVMVHPEAYAGQTVLTRARIRDVCQKKGCWMVLAEGDENMRVRFEDYGFFVPRDSSGKVAYVEGRVETKVISESTARHYAEESQTERPSEIVGPQRVTSFIARGVRLVSSE
jgi:hypothetical protein